MAKWFFCLAVDERDAEIQLNKRRGIISAGAEGVTWSVGLSVFLETISDDQGASNRDQYSRVIRDFIQTQGDMPIVGTPAIALTRQMNWARDRRRDALSKAHPEVDLKPTDGNPTANRVRTLMLSLARALRATGHIPPDPLPIEIIKQRPTKDNRGKSIPLNQIDRYYSALPVFVQLPFLWMILTGWRSTPTCDLMLSDIDMGAGVVRCTQKRSKERDEPLDEHLLDIIERARAYKDQIVKDGPQKQSPYVFVGYKKPKMDKWSILKAMRRAWRAAGLEPIKIHDLRTTFATTALKSFSSAKVQASLQHKDLRSTEHYNDQVEMQKSIGEVGASVRVSILSVLLHRDAQNDANNDKTIQNHSSDEVWVECAELGIKGFISKKKALGLMS
jgi:integrase